MTALAPAPPFTVIDDKEFLVRMVDLLKGQQRKATFVFGTGLTIALSGHEAATWPGLLQEVIKLWHDKEDKLPLEVISPSWVLSRSLEGDCLIAAAYVLFRQMRLLRGYLFEDAVREIVSSLCLTAHNKLATDKSGQCASLVNSLQELGKHTRKGRARIITTNYDDLVAHHAGLKVLLPDGRFFEPMSASAGVTTWAKEWNPIPVVPERYRRMEAWLNINLTIACTEEIASVLHLHGWYCDKDAVVIDPVGYHEITNPAQDSSYPPEYVRGQCNSKVADAMGHGPMIYYGMGAGMLDQHFEALRRLAGMDRKPGSRLPDPKDPPPLLTEAKRTQLAERNFWILDEKTYTQQKDTWARQMADEGGKTPPVTIVKVEKVSQLHQLLADTISKI